MRAEFTIVAIILLWTSAVLSAEPTPDKMSIYPELQEYLKSREAEFDQIDDDRKSELKKIAAYVSGQRKAGKPARLTFICTHNSRRSHLSQLWAATAATYYGVAGIETFSGGTEATAFNPRAVAAIKRAGLKVEKAQDGNN